VGGCPVAVVDVDAGKGVEIKVIPAQRRRAQIAGAIRGGLHITGKGVRAAAKGVYPRAGLKGARAGAEIIAGTATGGEAGGNHWTGQRFGGERLRAVVGHYRARGGACGGDDKIPRAQSEHATGMSEQDIAIGPVDQCPAGKKHVAEVVRGITQGRAIIGARIQRCCKRVAAAIERVQTAGRLKRARAAAEVVAGAAAGGEAGGDDRRYQRACGTKQGVDGEEGVGSTAVTQDLLSASQAAVFRSSGDIGVQRGDERRKSEQREEDVEGRFHGLGSIALGFGNHRMSTSIGTVM